MIRSLTASVAALVLTLLVGCGGGASGTPATPPPAAGLVVETLQTSGTPGNRINLALLGDGYRAQDQDKLAKDARAFLTTFQKAAPYSNYAAFFNVKLVHLVSNEDGAANGMHGFGVTRDTALGAAFQNANPPGMAPDYRLLVVDNARAQAVVMANAPECSLVLVLVNDTNYGGSGGALSVFSANPSSAAIALHEFGHTFGGLADEYTCGETGALPGSFETYPNVTTRMTLPELKWAGWIPPGVPLPTPCTWLYAAGPGLFEGGYYHDTGVYRPRETCRMRALADPFCEVCSEAIVRGVYARMAPLDGATPAGPVQVAPGSPLTLAITRPVPNPDTFQVTWTLDGNPVTGQGDSLTLQLPAGTHTVSARVLDATPLVRAGQERLTQVHTWSVTVGTAVQAMTIPAPEQHQVVRVTRTASGFQVVDRQILDLPLPAQTSGTWQLEALDQDGRVRFQAAVADPTELRGEFQDPDDPAKIQGHHLTDDRPVSFLVRLPVDATHRLELYAQPRGGQRQALGGAFLTAP